MNDILIFLHVAKTGGTTLGSILAGLFPLSGQLSTHVGKTFSALGVWPADEFGRTWAALESTRKAEIKHLAGHSLFGVHRVVSRPCRYIGMVREPVDRVASSYYYISTQPSIPVYEQIAKGMSLSDYIDCKVGLDAHNYQTRILSGDERCNATWDQVGEVLSKPIPESVLQVAKENIAKHFAVLGPMEQFDRVLMLLKLKFSFPMRSLLYEKKNVNHGRPSRDRLDESTIEKIKCANTLDSDLYQFVVARFERECALFNGLVDLLVVEFQTLLVAYRHACKMSDKSGFEALDLECARLDAFCRGLRIGSKE